MLQFPTNFLGFAEAAPVLMQLLVQARKATIDFQRCIYELPVDVMQVDL